MFAQTSCYETEAPYFAATVCFYFLPNIFIVDVTAHQAFIPPLQVHFATTDHKCCFERHQGAHSFYKGFPHPLRPQTGRPRMGKAISLHCLLLSFTGTLHPFQGPWHYLGTGAHPTTPASLLKKAPLVTNCEQTPWRPSLAATHSSLLAGYAAPGMPQLGIATLRLVIPLSHVPI